MLGVGVIGAGGVAKNHISAWLKLESAKVLAVADADPKRAKEAAAALGITRWTTDYLELLGWDGVDAVDICTTEATHGRIASDAAGAGKHVLVEKPIATTLEDSDRIILAAHSAGVRLMVAHTYHFYDHFVDSVLTDTEPMCGAQAARDTLEITLAALESARENRVVELPLTNGS
ncbi:MAG: Gfo/Idh/MocA family oxidoreductase [SAR202 cluster bacterium]|nr:Gfo/Idh/MocA family oxidoreductase [SAR202 cluster bacterium]